MAATDPDYTTEGQAYANTNGTCTPKPVYSAIRTENFTKNNCADGYEGSVVSFSKSYNSYVSQADADNLAATDPNYVTEGQAYANTNGTCTSTLPPEQFNIYFWYEGLDKTIRIINTRQEMFDFEFGISGNLDYYEGGLRRLEGFSVSTENGGEGVYQMSGWPDDSNVVIGGSLTPEEGSGITASNTGQSFILHYVNADPQS